MTVNLQTLLNTDKPSIVCFGCSYTSIGAAAESYKKDLDDWPKYLAKQYPNYNIINLAVGGSSLQHAILRVSKLLRNYPKEKYNYKIILQITGKCRYVPFKDTEYDKIFDEEIIRVSKNYSKTTLNLEGETKKFTLGAIESKFWKGHWWVKNYLKDYSDHYIDQDFFGNILLAEKISDFVFFWQDWEKNSLRRKFNLEFNNYAIEELGGRDVVSKRYAGDEYFHFNTRGAKKVAEWIKQKTQWT